MTDLPDAGVGRRVRAARKLASGLTQAALAQRMHVSVSLIKAVEQERVPASPSFVAAAARALGLTVYDLYEQPAAVRFGEERSHVSELETAVMAGSALASDGPVISIDELGMRARQIAKLHRRSQYATSSELMPDLLADLHTAVAVTAAGHDRERLFRLLAEVYGCALSCLHRLGSPLSGQASERAADAAKQSGDALLAALADAETGLSLMHRGAYAVAGRIAERAARSIEEQPTTAESATIRGYLHLRQAILAARCGDASSADAHLNEAGDHAERLPEISDLYDTAFCKPNVVIHSVASAVELGDGTTALGRTKPLPATMMISRQGHHHVDLARAWLLHGDRDKAFAELNTARTLTPQLTRYSPQVRETLVVLAESDRRKTDSLTGFARWAGVRL